MSRKAPKRLFRERRTLTHAVDDPNADLATYAVLVPFQDKIEWQVEEQLRGLERLGLQVFRKAGCSAIDYGRNALATAAMLDGKAAVLFIDSDVRFNPKDAIRILRRPEPVVAGVYPQKKFGKLNIELSESVPEISFGEDGRDYVARGVGAGFLRIRAEAFQQLIEFHDLPCCTRGDNPLWPWFCPFYEEVDGVWCYFSEDFAFCRRCTQAGIPVIADTRIPLLHVGSYSYGWDEAAQRAAPERSRRITIPHFWEKKNGQANG